MKNDYLVLRLRDDPNYFVGLYIDGKFVALISIHDSPEEAINAAERMNADPNRI